jgi:hypothetical protein
VENWDVSSSGTAAGRKKRQEEDVSRRECDEGEKDTHGEWHTPNHQEKRQENQSAVGKH